MTILGNFIPHKLLKFKYKQPLLVNRKIYSSHRNCEKLTKLFYKNSSDSFKEVLMSKPT